MTEIRKKQKKLYKIMKSLIIFTASFLIIFIGAQPYVKAYNEALALGINYFCDISVVICLIVIFFYYSKYGKCDYILSCAEDEINDAGYYLTSRDESSGISYIDQITQDLQDCGFSVNTNVECTDFTFDVRGFKRSEYFYIASIDSLDANDITAYLDESINDITVKSLKRKGDAVVCFITDKSEENAVALGKMITPIGRKNQLKIALAILEKDTGRVYFNGFKDTKCKKMIANYVMNCNIPIKDRYIVTDKLPYQYELKNRLDKLTLKEIKSDNFYIH